MMPPFVTVTRRLHPLEGQMLRVLGKMHRHGEEELLLVLGDGSKSLIPSAWTDFSGTRARDDDAPEGTATLGRLEDLLWASELARAGWPSTGDPGRQAARKPPSKEDNRATCAAESARRAAPGARAERARGAGPRGRQRGDRPAGRPHRQSLNDERPARGDGDPDGGADR